MKVILQTDLKGHGKKGQLVEVSDGFARNYLLPRKLATEANKQNLTVMETQNKAKIHHIEEEKESAMEIKNMLSEIIVDIKAKAGTGGRLFGSVTSKEIAEELLKVHRIDIDKRKILLLEPIKTFGTYSCEVKIVHNITGNLTVRVSE